MWSLAKLSRDLCWSWCPVLSMPTAPECPHPTGCPALLHILTPTMDPTMAGFQKLLLSLHRRLMALRANSELLDTETRDKELVVEV